ncbi:MAG TPA: hypothetical protein VFW74_09855 [Acidimicrobiia bacterium]|nr:hypothetical protein [Acidimicrobiia bacterium]
MSARTPGGDRDEPIEELVEEAREDNPDETTRREAYELELMEEDRSTEGAEVEVDEPE